MILRDFRVGWRLLIKEPVYSIVVTLGLAFGFAACFLLLNYVQYSFSYDSNVPDNKNVYVVQERFNFFVPIRWGESAPYPFLNAAVQSGLVSAGTSVKTLSGVTQVNNIVTRVTLRATDLNFPLIFGVKVIEGDLKSALSRPDGLALTQRAAKKLFGDLSYIGKTARIDGNQVQVLAILADPPTNTTLPYDALVGFETVVWPVDNRNKTMTDTALSQVKIYLKLRPDASRAALTQILQDVSDNSSLKMQLDPGIVERLGQQKLIDVRLTSLADSYFDPDMENALGAGRRGDKKVVLGLATTAILILLLATINYVNLATVQLLRRQREISVRKVLGAGVANISGQFLAESLLVSMIATSLGLILAEGLLPIFETIVNRKLDDLFQPTSILAGAIFGFMVGLISGAYPSWIALGNRPQQALSGRSDTETVGALWLRRFLTVLQFATAIGLTATTLAVSWQTQYSININPGFNAEPLLVVDTPIDLHNPNSRAFRNALTRIPGVSGVASSEVAVGRNNKTHVGQVRSPNGNDTSAIVKLVSPEFFEVYGVPPIAGRMFDKKIDPSDDASVVVINAAAARALEFEPAEAAIGQILFYGKRGDQENALRIIGVAPDIRNGTAREPTQPTIYTLDSATTVVTVRLENNVEKVHERIESLWRQYFPNDELEIESARSILEESYGEDLRLMKILVGATILSIVIAAFGIYVLSAYTVRRLTRQIVLRKLYGASPIHIAMLLVREFMTLVAVGAFIGLPIAMIMVNRYLSTFIDRAPIGLWTIPMALGLVLVVVFISTAKNTFDAMRLSPALALKA